MALYFQVWAVVVVALFMVGGWKRSTLDSKMAICWHYVSKTKSYVVEQNDNDCQKRISNYHEPYLKCTNFDIIKWLTTYVDDRINCVFFKGKSNYLRINEKGNPFLGTKWLKLVTLPIYAFNQAHYPFEFALFGEFSRALFPSWCVDEKRVGRYPSNHFALPIMIFSHIGNFTGSHVEDSPDLGLGHWEKLRCSEFPQANIHFPSDPMS